MARMPMTREVRKAIKFVEIELEVTEIWFIVGTRQRLNQTFALFFFMEVQVDFMVCGALRLQNTHGLKHGKLTKPPSDKG